MFPLVFCRDMYGLHMIHHPYGVIYIYIYIYIKLYMIYFCIFLYFFFSEKSNYIDPDSINKSNKRGKRPRE